VNNDDDDGGDDDDDDDDDDDVAFAEGNNERYRVDCGPILTQFTQKHLQRHSRPIQQEHSESANSAKVKI